MKVAIGCDHGGYILKQACIDAIVTLGYEVVDYGTDSCDVSVDYPDFALKVAKAVASGEADKGILLCGTGIGISIAANKVRGIRCAHVTDIFSAQMAAEHNNSNIIAMGGRITSAKLAKEMALKFLTTPFAGGRHQTRINKITDIENNNL